MKKKSKLKNILMFVAVILIWGYVIKTKFGFFNSDNDFIVAVPQESFALPKKYKKDTFELSLSSKDPFLGGSKTYKVNNSYQSHPANNGNPNNIRTNPTISVVQPTKWPKISYYGYVKNRTKGKQACLIQINYKTHKMFLNGMNNDVTLKMIFKDSVIVQFGKEIRTIKKM